MQTFIYLCELGAFVCLIIVLIKLFQQKGVLHGFLGIICFLYTFIWGWMEATRLNLKVVMLIWTALGLTGSILNFLARHY